VAVLLGSHAARTSPDLPLKRISGGGSADGGRAVADRAGTSIAKVRGLHEAVRMQRNGAAAIPVDPVIAMSTTAPAPHGRPGIKQHRLRNGSNRQLDDGGRIEKGRNRHCCLVDVRLGSGHAQTLSTCFTYLFSPLMMMRWTETTLAVGNSSTFFGLYCSSRNRLESCDTKRLT